MSTDFIFWEGFIFMTQAAFGDLKLLACSSARAPHIAPVRHFSANISMKFSGKGLWFAELRPFPTDEQILLGAIKAFPFF